MLEQLEKMRRFHTPTYFYADVMWFSERRGWRHNPQITATGEEPSSTSKSTDSPPEPRHNWPTTRAASHHSGVLWNIKMSQWQKHRAFTLLSAPQQASRVWETTCRPWTWSYFDNMFNHLEQKHSTEYSRPPNEERRAANVDRRRARWLLTVWKIKRGMEITDARRKLLEARSKTQKIPRKKYLTVSFL